VFGYLGSMAVAQLADAGVAAYRGDLALLCDNPFLESMSRGLRAAGAHLRTAETIAELLEGPGPEAMIVAMTPGADQVLGDVDLTEIARRWPGVVITQFWGDIDRVAAAASGLDIWPVDPPRAGHMGVLPSRLGPAPVVRLQAAGLKVAQVLLTPPDRRTPADLEFLDVI
jgi:hypothetical protein